MEAIWWAGAMIWLGLALGAEALDILPDIGETEGEWWPWIFIGLGPWSVALNIHWATSDGPKPTTWDWIWTAIFMALAIGALVDFDGEVVGAVVLVVVGAVLMTRALSHRD
jgi:hypothetical protein